MTSRREPILQAVERAFSEEAPNATDRGRPAGRTVGRRPLTPTEIDASPPRGASPRWGGPQAKPEERLGALFNPSPKVRRQALAVVSGSGVGPKEAVALGRVMLQDPEPAHRWLAAEALAPIGARLPLDAIERALADPDERVRRAAVELAALKGPAALPILIPYATARTWPASQLATLGALPSLFAGAEPLPRELLDRLLLGVAALDPPPLTEERSGLAEVARAIGVHVVAARLAGSVRVRLGAARLLLAEGGTRALTVVSAMRTEDSRDLMGARMIAASRLRTLQLAAAPYAVERPRTIEAAPPRPSSSDADVDEVTMALARALADPDAAVRAEARSALLALPPPAVDAWVRRALGEGGEAPTGQTALACAVAEQVVRPALAEPVLRAAVASSPEDRGPYLRALAPFAAHPETLVTAIRALEAGARADAVRLAWQVGGRGILAAIGGLIGDPAGPVRVAVLEAYDDAADPTAFDLARRLLQRDSSPAVRVAAVRVLAPADDARRGDGLADALHDPDPEVRAIAVETLPRRADGRFAALLLAAVRDDDEDVWRTAVAQLVRIVDVDPASMWDAIRENRLDRRDALVSAMEEHRPQQLARMALDNVRAGDPEDRMLAVQLAARAGTTECASAVLDALVDPDPNVRRAAAGSMASLRSPSTIRALGRTLSDPKSAVRIEAVRALGLIDDDTVPDVLIEALKDPEVRVREMAADALVRWRSPSVANRLALTLHSPDLRRPAAAVLERMGSAAIDPLVEVAVGGDREASRAAGGLIERIAGLGRFVEELASVDPDARLRAVRVLRTVGGTPAGDALLGALGDPDVRVRATAAASLGDIGERRAIVSLRRMFVSDPVAEVAAAAESSLAKLASEPTSNETADRGWLDVTEESPTITLEAEHVGDGTDPPGAETGNVAGGAGPTDAGAQDAKG